MKEKLLRLTITLESGKTRFHTSDNRSGWAPAVCFKDHVENIVHFARATYREDQLVHVDLIDEYHLRGP